MPRSNNAVEGWHYKMNSKSCGSHPSVWKCIQKLQEEQKYWEDEMIRIRTGLGASKKTKYIMLDERLGKIIPFYSTTLDTVEYLLAVSTCMFEFYK